LKFIILTTTIALLSAGAYAGNDAFPVDLVSTATEVAEYSWTGAYLGVHAGYGFGRNKNKYTHFRFSEFNEIDNFFGVGFVGGLQAGYIWQSGPIVFGIETDLQYSRTKIEHISSTFDMDWSGTSRLRLGFLVDDRLLVYGTGGAAFGKQKIKISEFFDVSPNALHISKTMQGWTVGVGVEHAIDSNWSLKNEYVYTNFEEMTLVNSRWESDLASLSFHTIRAGLNYKF